MTTKPRNVQMPDALAPRTQEQLLELTIAVNGMAAGTDTVNSYQVRNQLLTRKEKARVRYRNGVTLPTSAEALLANAERRDYNHRRTLSRSIVQGTGQTRPKDVCAHHIVALHASAAARSRDVLFRCGVGINDVDNGVFLPRYASKLPNHPDAPRHDPHHHPSYHAAVLDQLQFVDSGDTQACRATLKSLKMDILDGRLPL